MPKDYSKGNLPFYADHIEFTEWIRSNKGDDYDKFLAPITKMEVSDFKNGIYLTRKGVGVYERSQEHANEGKKLLKEIRSVYKEDMRKQLIRSHNHFFNESIQDETYFESLLSDTAIEKLDRYKREKIELPNIKEKEGAFSVVYVLMVFFYIKAIGRSIFVYKNKTKLLQPFFEAGYPQPLRTFDYPNR